jgi:hypothetical protein
MRRAVDFRALMCGALLLSSGGCEVGGSGRITVLPGPAVPSPVAANPPYVWDTREELDVWVNNPVTRGPAPMSLVGDGPDAVVRIEPTPRMDDWVLRGPDLTSPARSIRGVRIRYRWRPDPALPAGSVLTFTLSASFEAVNPPYPPQQPIAYAQVQPAQERTDAEFRPGTFRDPVDVRYVYLRPSGSPAGVFEIDRIELVQAER